MLLLDSTMVTISPRNERLVDGVEIAVDSAHPGAAAVGAQAQEQWRQAPASSLH
jgi:hypothetical protein